MTEMQNDEISARTGFLNRSVMCRIAEAGLEVLRDGKTTRIGYDGFTEIRLDRRGSGRAALSFKTLEGATTTLRFLPEAASAVGIDDFVKSLLQRVAGVSPKTRFVMGPTRSQWVASLVGVLASCAVLLFAAGSLLSDRHFGPLFLPVGIALVNLAVVLPIVRSGKPRHFSAVDAPTAFS